MTGPPLAVTPRTQYMFLDASTLENAMKLIQSFCFTFMLLTFYTPLNSQTAPEQREAQTLVKVSFEMFDDITLSETLIRLGKVAFNKATPEEELWFSHLVVFIDTLEALKKSMEEQENPNFYNDLLESLKGNKKAQQRVAAQSAQKAIDLYLKTQKEEWAKALKEDGTSLYTQDQLEELERRAPISRIKRIITGQASKKERMALWVVIKCKNAVLKIRSWRGGTKLGLKTEKNAIKQALTKPATSLAN